VSPDDREKERGWPLSARKLAKIAEDLGFHFDDADLLAYRQLLAGSLEAYSVLDQLPEALPQPRYPRLPARRSARSHDLGLRPN